MDRKVQERLIGAVVLVLLGVWLIPWILDGQQGPSPEVGVDASEFELPTPNDTGPGREPPMQTIEIDLAASREPAVAAPAITRRAAADTASSPLGGTESAESQKSARTASLDREGTGAATPSRSSTSAGWMVQLGSFSDEENARRQADRVESYGYDPTISSFVASGRSMYRVRIGPHETRDSAEAAASALSVHGFVSQVIAPE